MTDPKKIVLHSVSGYRPELDALVAQWKRRGVIYVGVVGVDAAKIEDAIDGLVVGDGFSDYSMLTACHPEPATLDEAKALATQLTGEFAGPFEVIEL